MDHPKNALLERCRRLGLAAPTFDTKSTGPAHERTFISDVLLDGEVIGTGQGLTKREAERRAAEEALVHLERSAAPASAPPRDQKKVKSTPEPRVMAPASTTVGSGDPFDGPWPIFDAVLATCLTIANSRVDPALGGEAAIAAVQQLGLRLYKATLEELGEVVEVEEPSA